jgi:hypothetical protein
MANGCTDSPRCSSVVVLVAASVSGLPDPLAVVAALVLAANRCWMQVPSETSHAPLFSMPLLDLAVSASPRKTADDAMALSSTPPLTCCCASKQGTANDAEAPSSAPPPTHRCTSEQENGL